MAEQPRHAAPVVPRSTSPLGSLAIRVTALRRFPDPETSADPRSRHVVTALRRVPAPSLDTVYRDELRAQLVAVTPRLVAEGASEIATSRPAGRREPATNPTPVAKHAPERHRLARPWALAGSFVIIALLALGGLTWVSKGSLPGDSLYGLKLASEDAQIHFASTDQARAYDYLQFSQLRVEESQQLLKNQPAALGGGVQASGGASAQTIELVTQSLHRANSDLLQGTTLLGKAAFARRSGAPLDLMEKWAPGQLQLLNTLVGSVPASLRSQAADARRLVDGAKQRGVDLQRRGATVCGRTGTDKYGPQACGATASAPSRPASRKPGSATPSGKTRSTLNTPSGNSGGRQPGTGSGSPSSKRARRDGSHHVAGNATGNYPPTSRSGSVPGSGVINRSGLPIRVGSCGIQGNAPVVDASVGTCPTGGS